MGLRRFDIDRPCPKCETRCVSDENCSQRRPTNASWFGPSDMHEWIPEGDHIHRTCGHCGYQWIELAKDTPLMADRTRRRVLESLIKQYRKSAEAAKEWHERMASL